MTRFFILPVALLFFSCGESESRQETKTVSGESNTPSPPDPIAQYSAQHPENGLHSQSVGTVGKGQLVNGKLLPFAGNNYHYFDTSSYLHGHAFVHEKVREAVQQSYAALEEILPDRHFVIMECSNEKGGRIFPHRTHQNGLSIDFMMPLQKNGQPYYGLDSSGQVHYLIDFDDAGRYKKDPSISIDFNTMALHLTELNKAARKNGLRIGKVILKIELKNEFFASVAGSKLRHLYFVTQLSPLINRLHDDHYHVDFEVVRSEQK